MSTAVADARIAVVGAGVVGLATARALAEAGADVTVLERGEPGNGQSGGESRIFRHAHDDPRLIELARESRTIWRRWATELGIETISSGGVLAIGGAVRDRRALLEQAGGIPISSPGPDDAASLLPLIAPLEPGGSDDIETMFDQEGGAIRTTAVIGALATGLGERLVRDEVLSLRPVAGGVELRRGGGVEVFDRVVLCAGIEAGRLARTIGLEVPVAPAAHLRATFAVREPSGPLPCLQDSSGIWGETGVYAAPEPGDERYAVGLAGTTPVREDGSLVDPAEMGEFDERVRAYVTEALPGLDPEPLEYRHCWVTALPWGEDAVSVWAGDGVFVPAGHNLFKQAPALGELLARAALGRGLDERLGPEARLGAS